MNYLRRCALYCAVSAFATAAFCADAPAASAGPSINFQRQVRPILSDNCFLCHGPDKGTRMANVRLDIKEGAFATRKNGAIIVPGKPDESLLIKRISSDNPGFKMPPPFSHKTLTAAQKDILRKWVEQGATWKDHWAFVAPVKHDPPAVKDTQWVRNPIDQFVLAKLEATNLTPAPEADRPTLIRRVTLDLTGLPPTPAEVDAFVNDKSPNAYEKVVDRLLESPHYGEQRAHYWLDAGRYADTQGLHIDNYREMWPYRDWVIKAFNNNMHFDEFTIEQLAGDLLPNATLDQKIASGFQRNNVTTNEGGAIPAEVEAIYAKDRADTMGTVWMGLTVGCATCHDHKFDPIAQKDYYALTSFFRNTTQYPLDGNVPDTPPTVVVPRDEDRARWTELANQREKLESQIKASTESNAAFEQWLQTDARKKAVHPFTGAEIASLNVATARLPKDAKVEDVPVATGKAIHLPKEASVTLPAVPQIDTDKPFTVSAWVSIPKVKVSYAVASSMEIKPKPKNAAGAKATQAKAEVKKPDPAKNGQDAKKEEPNRKGQSPDRWGWSFALESLNGEPTVPVLRLMDRSGKMITAQPSADYGLKPGEWYQIIFTYDGRRDRRGINLFINGNHVESFGNGGDLAPLAASIRTSSPVRLGQIDKQYFEDGRIAGFRILNKQADAQDAKLLYAADTLSVAGNKPVADMSQNDRLALLTYYTQEVDPTTKADVAELHKLDAERQQIARRGAITFVQQERTDSVPTAHVLYRGQYDQMKDEVHPTVPSILPPMKASLPRNRLGLAEWLVDPVNPLTSRVTVNRLWQETFGTGIVKTAGDFGSQGEPPSNQDLLDWLAVDFRENNWDVKREFKLIVTSATYRQSAAATPEKLEKDPDNRLLSRGPRFRMDAEMVRDYALAASGLLVPTIGGPSVKPYQPKNIWETVAMDVSNTRYYHPDSGAGLYRRSLYTFWKRSAPPPSMDIFNAPSREVCIVQRERTDTPLQALVTMNDPQFVEAARALAQNAVLSSGKDVDSELSFMTERLMARSLDAKEHDVVAKSYRDYLAYYQSAPADAEKLIHVGESKPDKRVPAPQLAAMTMVANELLNLDEVLNK